MGTQVLIWGWCLVVFSSDSKRLAEVVLEKRVRPVGGAAAAAAGVPASGVTDPMIVEKNFSEPIPRYERV